MRFTVLGARGFVGSHLVAFLKNKGVDCVTPTRDEQLKGEHLGHVIYCIGLTADFRTRTLDTVESHVCALLNILKNCDYDSFLYLSSVRVYKNAQSTNEEAALTVNPRDPDDVYNISKIMGESLCLAIDNPAVRVARLSNVVGYNANRHDFVDALITEALTHRIISLQTSLNSEKDYIAIENVVEILSQIARSGQDRLYNVASGSNTTHRTIVNTIAELTNCDVKVQKDAPTIIFHPIDVSRIASEFHIFPRDVKKSIERIVREYGKEK